MSVRLIEAPFEPGSLLTQFSSGRSETGAVATFTGIARSEAGATAILELEAYPGFTEGEIGRIAEEARRRWDLHDLMILHRVGKIGPGEPIVFVATAAAHRRAAFEACDFLMDYLKSRAPFWKKEEGPDGQGSWVDARESDDDATARWQRPEAEAAT